MERIQTAINKARKARQVQQSDTTVSPLVQPEAIVPQKVADTPIVEPLVLTAKSGVLERDQAWANLKSFDPSPSHLEKKRIVAYQSGPDAVPYDVLRTRMLHQMRANNWKRVAITSPASGAGKSMTCVNLCFSLARQPEQRTMLIELDMRKPSLSQLLGVKENKQFSNALQGKDNPEDHMVRYGRNLAFAVNTTTARSTAELLQGETAARVLDQIEAQYMPDLMIFDMPPIFASDDTMAFLDQVDCALLIGEAEKTTIDEIDKCEQELAARTNVLGVMLNKCRYLVSHEGYGKQYGY